MAKIHNVFNGYSVAYQDVDAFNLVGIPDTDVDNGNFVKIKQIKNTSGKVGEFVFEVTTSQCSAPEYVIATPIPGTTNYIEPHIYVDPRHFVNEADKPASLKKLVKGDIIGCTIYSGDTLTTEKGAKVVSGKITAATSSTEATLDYLGKHFVDIGGEDVDMYMFMVK